LFGIFSSKKVVYEDEERFVLKSPWWVFALLIVLFLIMLFFIINWLQEDDISRIIRTFVFVILGFIWYPIFRNSIFRPVMPGTGDLSVNRLQAILLSLCIADWIMLGLAIPVITVYKKRKTVYSKGLSRTKKYGLNEPFKVLVYPKRHNPYLLFF